MPRYDYRCTSCACVFEVTRPAGISAGESCPECGSDARRVFTPVGVVFKGSGFHNTDYRPQRQETPAADAAAPAAPAAACGSDCASCPAAE
ncbi:MAG: FmdB family transcriptional regulator [Coriobacteriia bacterium]|nr:FmdB family transcriptional regulator [Coriobacteriia bacterium]